MWKKLYTSYVRPLLEFAIPVWNPHQKGDMKTLERIQHRATKIAHSLKSHDYKTRCEILKLSTLNERRIRGDLIQKFKIEKKLDEIDWSFEPITGLPQGGHRGYLRREIVKNCDQRHYFFNNRIASAWNDLPNEIISATTVNSLKNQLDVYLESKRLKLPQAVIYY